MHNRSTLRAGIALAALALAAAAPAAAQNATGKPVIAGKPQVGHTLLGVVRGISDPELSVSGAGAIPGLAYQWAHIDGTTVTAIEGANKRFHTLVPADQGQRMGLRVSFTDDGGVRESVLSEATAAVAAAETDPDCAPPNFGGREVVWTATATFLFVPGVAYYATDRGVGSLDNVATRLGGTNNGIEAITLDTSSLPAGVQGRLVVAFDHDVGDDDLINPSSVKAAFRSDDADNHRWFELHIVCGDANGDVDNLSLRDGFDGPGGGGTNQAAWNIPSIDWSGVTERVMYLSFPANQIPQGRPTISGAVAAGGTLTASVDSVRENAGVRASSVTFRWYRSEGGAEALIPGSTTSGSTSGTYAVTPDDVGPDLRLRARAWFYDLEGNLEEMATDWVSSPPTLRSSVLAADGVTLALTYDGDLDEGSVPPAGAFTVRVGGAVRPLAAAAPVAVSGRTVVLTLAEPAHAGEAVTVAYDKPTPPPPLNPGRAPAAPPSGTA